MSKSTGYPTCSRTHRLGSLSVPKDAERHWDVNLILFIGELIVVFLRLYRSLVRSKLDYGSIVYGSASKSLLQQLDPIHHQGLRIALGAFVHPLFRVYTWRLTNRPCHLVV